MYYPLETGIQVSDIHDYNQRQKSTVDHGGMHLKTCLCKLARALNRQNPYHCNSSKDMSFFKTWERKEIIQKGWLIMGKDILLQS
jgi:hypothetical protein